MITTTQLPRIIGHRGAKGLAPENTLAGFRAAADAGARWVEFDVQLSSDDVPVLFHDDDIERLSGDLGRFTTLPLAIIKNLEVGSHFSPAFSGEGVPTFAEAMTELASLDLGANVEIKLPDDASDEMAEKTARVIADVVRSDWPDVLPPPLLSSFDARALRALRDTAPDLARAFIFSKIPDGWMETALGLACGGVHVAGHRVSEKLVGEAHDAGLLVRAYTINERTQAEALFAMGVDGIFTDFPDQLAGL